MSKKLITLLVASSFLALPLGADAEGVLNYITANTLKNLLIPLVRLKNKHISKAESYMRASMPTVPLPQCEFNSLIDIAFNAGCGGAQGSSTRS